MSTVWQESGLLNTRDSIYDYGRHSERAQSRADRNFRDDSSHRQVRGSRYHKEYGHQTEQPDSSPSSQSLRFSPSISTRRDNRSHRSRHVKFENVSIQVNCRYEGSTQILLAPVLVTVDSSLTLIHVWEEACKQSRDLRMRRFRPTGTVDALEDLSAAERQYSLQNRLYCTLATSRYLIYHVARPRGLGFLPLSRLMAPVRDNPRTGERYPYRRIFGWQMRLPIPLWSRLVPRREEGRCYGPVPPSHVHQARPPFERIHHEQPQSPNYRIIGPVHDFGFEDGFENPIQDPAQDYFYSFGEMPSSLYRPDSVRAFSDMHRCYPGRYNYHSHPLQRSTRRMHGQLMEPRSHFSAPEFWE